jgi:hypothetical protein
MKEPRKIRRESSLHFWPISLRKQVVAGMMLREVTINGVFILSKKIIRKWE